MIRKIVTVKQMSKTHNVSSNGSTVHVGNSLTADLSGRSTEKRYIMLGIIFHSFNIKYLAFLFTKTFCSNNHLEFGKFISFELLSHQDKTYHMLEEGS